MTFSDTDSLTNNLTLAPGDVAAGWSFSIVDNSGIDNLQTAYTVAPAPEPRLHWRDLACYLLSITRAAERINSC
jgi:hypothetical protein